MKIDPGIGDLLEKLDGLPLALATAGGFLGMTGIPVSEYLHDYEASWLEIQETSPDLLSYEDKRIYSTWDLSYNHIRKEDESAAKLLEFWAYFDNQDLWYDLLKAGDSEQAPDWFQQIVGTKQAFRAAVMKLQKHALVELSKDSHGYSMHHCVHAWVKNVLSKTIEDQHMNLALDCIVQIVPFKHVRQDWMTRQRLLPHSERCLKLLRVWDQGDRNTESKERYIAWFYEVVGLLYYYQGRLMEAESMLLRGFNTYKKVYGSDSEATLAIAESLADVHVSQGRVTESESMYKRVLAGYEKMFEPDHENALAIVQRLGVLYSKQGKLVQSESMYRRALTGRESIYGPDHESTLDVVNCLGFLYTKQGKLKEAESMHQHALTGYEKFFGPDHVYTLGAVGNLGIDYRRQGKLKEAESMYRRAILGFNRKNDPDHYTKIDQF